MPVLSAVEAQLSLHQCNTVKEPQKHGNVQKLVANYKPAEVRQELQWCFSTQCPIHELHDSQRRVTRTYLVPACISPAAV